MARTSMSGLAGEVLHTGAVRYRVTGTGNLQTFLRSLDDVRNVQLKNLPMSTVTNIEPTILANFQEQRVQLELKVIVMNESFNISRIVVFVKPVAEGYPII